MTGYAYGEAETDAIDYSIEIKSYNARFLDMSVNLPPYLGRLESRFRQYAAEGVRRGKVDVTVKIKHLRQKAAVSVDETLAKSFKTALESMAAALGMAEPVPLSLVAAQEGVLSVQNGFDIEEYWSLMFPLFESTMKDFLKEREREGENLRADILKRIEALEQAASVFERWQDQMEEVFRENVQKKFREVLGNEIDEQRVLTEIAALLVKYTVSEEIIRLKSHIESLKAELDSGDSPGRKIDFICQELNREINTIGAKNQCLEAGRAVVDAKNALESIREQARNIE
jgi:uncharacterized protein (TIGR00255 family)